MLLADHRLRVGRLLRGEQQISDLDRLFADLRLVKPGRASVQEIGHFAAHRDERDNGISLDRANDIQTSARLWCRQNEGVRPSIADIKEATRANLRIIPEDRIREKLGISRQTAQTAISKGIKKLESGKPLKAREREAVNLFGFSMAWQFAFNDQLLFSDFTDLLILEGALSANDRSEFEKARQFISLYALSIMHGTRLKMVDGGSTQLHLAASDSTGNLRIKAAIPITGLSKLVTMSVPLFETMLNASDHCDADLLEHSLGIIPLDIKGDRLVALA